MMSLVLWLVFGLVQEIQELQDAVAGMRAEPSPLEAARAELEACKGDRAKFLRLLEQLQVGAACFGAL